MTTYDFDISERRDTGYRLGSLQRLELRERNYERGHKYRPEPTPDARA